MDLEKRLLAKFHSDDNFLITLRLGKGLDMKDFQEMIDAIYALKSDSLTVSKELAMLFVEVPRIINGGLGLYGGSELKEILDARTMLYRAIYDFLLPSSTAKP